MEKTKLIITLVSVVILTSLFAYLVLEVTSRATRYIIEGSFDVTEDGDLTKYVDFGGSSTSEFHWKRIDVPQLELADMPSVQVFVKTTFESIENETEPIDLWISPNPNIGWAPHVLYDDGSIYIEFKERYKSYDIFNEEWKQGVAYIMDGNYKIVVVK